MSINTRRLIDFLLLDHMANAGRENGNLMAIHDDIVDHCREAWNKLVAQPWKIMSIGNREWADRL